MKRASVVLSLTCLVVLSLAPTTLAQESDCVALLRHGVYDKFRETSSSSSAAQLRASICEAYNRLQIDKRNASVQAQYKLIGGEAAYSSEQLDSIGQFMCASLDTSSSASSNLAIIQDRISQAAMDAYRECVALNASGMKTKTIFREEDQGQVTIELRYVAPVGAPPQTTISRVVINPANAFTCQGPLIDLQGRPNAVGTQAVAMACERRIGDPVNVDGQSVLAPPATITVMTTSGTITRSLTTRLAAPAPTPLKIPVGTIIIFSGTRAEAESQQPFGWQICDGHTINDPLAGTFNGRSTPDLRDKFVMGAPDYVAGNAGGKTAHGIENQTITVTASSFTSPATNHGPRMGGPHVGEGWGNYHRLESKGTVVGSTVPTIPPYYTVIYLIKVR